MALQFLAKEYFWEKFDMNPRVAIVSYFSVGAYDANSINEDEILSNILTELGIENQVVAWSDPKVDWEGFSCLLIKSVWDYFDYYPQFLEWIEKMKELGIPALNDLDTIRWNSTKAYLLEVQERGIPTIAGKIITKKGDLNKAAISLESDTVVVKPLVSGGAKNTFKIHISELSQYEEKISKLLEDEAFLVQPFVSEVAEVGEYSLLFFNGVFSHAVLKTPAQEDFRVQHYFGGTIQEVKPSDSMLESAKRIMREFAGNTLYARVDGVVINGIFHLMELELIEPYLFLGLSQNAIPNYKQALKVRLL